MGGQSQGVSYVAEDNASLFEHLGLVVVVDVEAREQNLVLVGGQSAL